jgi:MinD-like ATPase involved in chromosome partitioning or flagellar assembly
VAEGEGVITTILGTKGGVGKSTIAIGISIFLSKKGRTLLIDGDPHVRSVELKLAPGMPKSLVDVMRGKASWKQAVYRCSLRGDGKPLYPDLAVMPAGASFLPPIGEGTLAEASRRLDGILSEASKKFRYIVIDTPASISYEHILLTAAGDGIIYVCEANDDSILAAKQTAEGMERLLDTPPTGVVLSKVPKGLKAEAWRRKAEQVAPVLGVVPADPRVDEAFRRNLPLDAFAPDCEANLAIGRIAEALSKIRGGKVRVREKIEGAVRKLDVLVDEAIQKGEQG